MDCIYTWSSDPLTGRASLNLDAKTEVLGPTYIMKYGVLDSFLHGPYNQP
jgi:hypothetical protein